MRKFILLGLISTVLMTGCSPSQTGVPPVLGPKDTPESNVGERLFRDPRFAKYFVEQSAGNPNADIAEGDPILNALPSLRRGSLPSPFAGQAMSCVACHMVGDAQGIHHAGKRGYTDFAQRSPIPHLSTDSLTTTTRNAPTLIDAFVGRTPFLLHYDGEFESIEGLIIGSYTGRNFGWLPGEEQTALANLVKVIREDDGHTDLARRFGSAPYRELLLGEDRGIDQKFRISKDYRIDVSHADDQAILNGVVSLIKVYLQALQFSLDTNGVNNGSAYDHFLAANHLPQILSANPGTSETNKAYAARLSKKLEALALPTYVNDDSGTFGKLELAGAKIFFSRGNCVACHTPPHFTDFQFHNTGETQDEYDSVHGQGAFAKLDVPSYAERSLHPELYLPASDHHPDGSGRFRMAAQASHPEWTDLGAWNTLFNADIPAPQAKLAEIFCGPSGCSTDADRDAALSRALGSFKTPGLRGLSLSDPYLHSGRKAAIQEVLRFYERSSELARAGQLRNADPELLKVDLNADDIEALTAFLNSLNEEYD